MHIYTGYKRNALSRADSELCATFRTALDLTVMCEEETIIAGYSDICLIIEPPINYALSKQLLPPSGFILANGIQRIRIRAGSISTMQLVPAACRSSLSPATITSLTALTEDKYEHLYFATCFFLKSKIISRVITPSFYS